MRLRLLRFLLPALCLLAPAALWALGGVSVDDTGETETVITLNVELCPKPKDDPATAKKEGLTTDEIQSFIDERKDEITAIWNACPTQFRTRRGAPLKTIRFVFNFTVIDDCKAPRDPNKKRFPVHPGHAPRSLGYNANSENLWVENTARTIAHELGHVMGLDEEYDPNPGGPTRENVMGRGSFTEIVPYQVMTILFLNEGNPDAAERHRRGGMKTYLRMSDQEKARDFAAQNGITDTDYDAYKDQFTANGSQMQPGEPTRPK